MKCMGRRMSHVFDPISVSVVNRLSQKTKAIESNQKRREVAIYAIITQVVDCRGHSWFSHESIRDCWMASLFAMCNFRPIGIKLKGRAVFFVMAKGALRFGSPRSSNGRCSIVDGRGAVAAFASYIDAIESRANRIKSTSFAVSRRMAKLTRRIHMRFLLFQCLPSMSVFCTFPLLKELQMTGFAGLGTCERQGIALLSQSTRQSRFRC